MLVVMLAMSACGVEPSESTAASMESIETSQAESQSALRALASSKGQQQELTLIDRGAVTESCQVQNGEMVCCSVVTGPCWHGACCCGPDLGCHCFDHPTGTCPGGGGGGGNPIQDP